MTSDDTQPVTRRDVSRMDDFQVIAERQRVMAALAALTDQYRALNQEIQRRVRREVAHLQVGSVGRLTVVSLP